MTNQKPLPSNTPSNLPSTLTTRGSTILRFVNQGVRIASVGLVCIGFSGCQTVQHPMKGRSANGLAQNSAGRPSMAQPSGPQQSMAQQSMAQQSMERAQQSMALRSMAQQAKSPVVAASYGDPRSTGIANNKGPANPQVVPAAYQGRAAAHPANCPCGHHGGKYQPVFSSGSENCLPLEGTQGDCLQGECMSDQACEVPGVYRGYDPQEYIFDGGDRLPKVVVQNDGTTVGLQPEDTVLHYETEKGCVKVEPACRAAIYAPRFASVRKIASVENRELAQGPRAAIQPLGPSSVDEKLPSPTLRQPLRVASEEGKKKIEAFRDRNRGVPIAKVLPVQNFSDALLPFEDLQLIRSGKVNETEKFLLQKGVAAALTWGSIESLQVIVDGQEAQVQRTVQGPQETVLYEIDGKPSVRICKVASQQMASPGDEVHFTIRVDNVGDRDVKNVVVLDSLPPRLEYVEGSQVASFETDFDIKENQIGSSILEWKLKKDLKSLDGGFIRFRCLVR